MNLRITTAIALCSLLGCTAELPLDTGTDDVEDTDTDTGGNRDADTDTDTESERRNQAQQCDHGGYLDAWFPQYLDMVELRTTDGVVTSYPFIDEDYPESPGWRMKQTTTIDTLVFGGRTFHLGIVRSAIAAEDADPEDMPGDGFSFYERGQLTQEGDTLIIESPSYRWDCVRRVRPTDPRDPKQQLDLLCVDAAGNDSVWLGLAWDGSIVRSECLAEHEPPELATRYALWEVETHLGRSVFPHEEPYGPEPGWASRLRELTLSRDGTGGIVETLTAVDPTNDYDPITWPERTETAISWSLDDDRLGLQIQDGPALDCEEVPLDEELADPIRTTGWSCTDSEGQRWLWVPMDMRYPWGWGSHDTPEGWWW